MKKLILISALLFSVNVWADTLEIPFGKKLYFVDAEDVYQIFYEDGHMIQRAFFRNPNFDGTNMYMVKANVSGRWSGKKIITITMTPPLEEEQVCSYSVQKIQDDYFLFKHLKLEGDSTWKCLYEMFVKVDEN
jgi:hypothetical protein